MPNKVANKRMVLSQRRKVETISFLNGLMSEPINSLDDVDAPPWFQVGQVHQVSPTLYAYHAESNSVRWIEGLKFMFANDSQPFQFYWSKGGEHFGRQLSEEETFRFCQLTDVKRYI